jgi:DNA polymerase III alpha subunit
MPNIKELRAILHAHSIHSHLDAVSKPEAYVKHCVNHEIPYLALTEHGQLSNQYHLFQATKGTGIQGISGNEIYLDLSEDFGGKDVYSHLTVLTYNDIGRRNLFLLFNKSFDKISKPRWGHKKPMNTWAQLIEHREGLFIGSGCCIGPAAKALLKGRPDLAEIYLDKLIEIFGRDNLFAEFMPTEAKWNWNRKTGVFEPNPCSQYAPNGCIVEGYQLWLQEHGVNKRKMTPCLTTDSHYVNKEEKFIQDLILMAAEGGWKFSQVLDIPTKEEMFEKLKYLNGFNESFYDSLIVNAEKFCERIEYKSPLTDGILKLPEFAV